MIRVLPFFLISLLMPGVAAGQVVRAQERQYLVRHYTNENGLPANGIKGIELDTTTGFLWVGTQAGLVRFDGMNFTGFSTPEKEVTASRIAFIARNREGTIYCEDDNFSVYRIAGNLPVFETTDTFLITPSILRGGSAPALPGKQLAARLRRLKRTAFLPHWIVYHDETGDSSSFSFVYFGHAWHYSAGADTLLDFPGFDALLKLEGRVYFVRAGTELWTYSDSLQQLVRAPVSGMPSGMLPATGPAGAERPAFIWQPGLQAPLLIYRKDIWILQRQGNSLSLQPFCRGCSPANARIISAQWWEKRGLLFLSSNVSGLYVLQARFLQTIPPPDVAGAGRAEYAQAEITPGIITTASGLRFTSAGALLRRATLPFFSPYTMFRDQYGDHWYQSADTILHWHSRQGRYAMMKVRGGINKMVFAQTQDRTYAITDAAIAEVTNDRFRPLYELPVLANALKNSLNPDAAVEWEPGVLAIATEKLVLFDTRKAGAPDTIPIPGLKVKVRSLLKYRDYLFIGTYGQGLYIYKNGVVKKMPLDKKRYLSYAHCFMPDKHGYCWISTNHGLFKASLRSLMAAYDCNLGEIYYHYFGRDDGLFNTEFNGGCQPCALPLSSGLYAFPSMNGVVLFDPSRLHASPPAGKLFIEEVLADSSSYQPGDSALQALPYYLRNLQVRLVLSQFANQENIYFSYKLAPYRDDWETFDIVENNTLRFSNLPPGSYTLYLRVRNGFDPDGFGTEELKFCILGPWYRTWWFYGLCGLGIIVVIWALVSWRTARINRRKKELQKLVTQQTASIAAQLSQLQGQQMKLEEDNRIKDRLITIISHDMLSPLKLMGYMSKNLRDAFLSSDPAYQTASAFVTVTHELESLSVNILNWIRFHQGAARLVFEQFDLHRLIDESTEIVSTLAHEKGVEFYNEVPETTLMWQSRQAVGVIVHNLAMNALKYTEKGEIRITGWSSAGGYTLSVNDTGTGMSPDLVELLNDAHANMQEQAGVGARRFQLGYAIIKDLLQLTRGVMNVESILHKGTQVIITLPNQPNSR